MIVRILNEGQYTLADRDLEQLNALDVRLQSAVEAHDSARFATNLEALLAAVRRTGTPVDDAALLASDLVLPSADSSLDEVSSILGDEGLIPG